MLTRHVVSLVVAASTIATLGSARADDPKSGACLDAYEQAQVHRKNAQLLSARQKLRICAGESCPAVTRGDCMEWLAQVEKSLPSIVLGAKGDAGPIFDVTVSMDGNVIAKQLDGKAIDVDPGLHVFVFKTEGKEPIEQKVIIRENEKSTLVSASWVTAPPPGQQPGPRPAQEEGGSSTPRTIGFIGGAIGIGGIAVGTIFGLNALSNDKDAAKLCPNNVCSPNGDELARRSQDQATISTIAFIAGGALVLGGALLVLLNQPKKNSGPSTGWKLAPTFTGSSGGLFLSGGF
jgi:hypothetical protein